MSRQPKLAEPGGPPVAFWAGLLLLAAVTVLLWAPGQKGFFALDDRLNLPRGLRARRSPLLTR